jgi:hypothetical protein
MPAGFIECAEKAMQRLRMKANPNATIARLKPLLILISEIGSNSNATGRQ